MGAQFSRISQQPSEIALRSSKQVFGVHQILGTAGRSFGGDKVFSTHYVNGHTVPFYLDPSCKGIGVVESVYLLQDIDPNRRIAHPQDLARCKRAQILQNIGGGPKVGEGPVHPLSIFA